MATPEFRKATLQDAQTIKGIAKRVIRTNYTSFLGEEIVSDFIESGMSDKEIDDGLGECTVMAIDGTITGFCIVSDDLLHLIMVDVAHQNNGYGRLLLSFAESMMFKKHGSIHLQTFENNTKTAQFYLKNGWYIANRQFVPELNQTMLCLQKER